jgi:hypothetical protein
MKILIDKILFLIQWDVNQEMQANYYLVANQKDDFEKDLQDYISNYHIQNAIDNYLPKLKIAFLVIISLMVAIHYIFSELLENTKMIEVILTRVRMFICLIVLALILIHFFPKHYTYLVPLFVGFGMDCTVNLSMNQEEYPVSETALPSICS